MRKLPGQAGLGVSLSTGAEQGRKLQFYHRPNRDRRPPGQLAHSPSNGASIKSRKHCITKLLNRDPPVDGIKYRIPPLGPAVKQLNIKFS